jgi:peptidoglycan/LPS O-acetylase OafA/YrhL
MQTALSDARPSGGADATAMPARDGAIDALRTFLTLLVVAHHAALAYHPFAPPVAGSLRDPPFLWSAFPVVDAHRSAGLDLFVGFNDTFFMSAMFLVSGLFVWPSLARKGAAQFLKDRALRLGLPFIAFALFSPVAYLPAYLQRAPSGTLSDFAAQWISLPFWPAGPVWFVAVLLAFDALAAAIFAAAPRAFERLGQIGSLIRKPVSLFGLLFAMTILVYLPCELAFGPFRWFTVGPFALQSSRVGLYPLYFFAGVALGAAKESGLFGAGSALERNWRRWTFAALVAFAISIALFIAAISTNPLPTSLHAIADLGLPLSCACSTIAALALAHRFARKPGMPAALSPLAYGLYLTHYSFVSWLQLSLASLELPGVAKALLVFAGASLCGFGVTWLWRLGRSISPRVAVPAAVARR